ncbi:DNA mismatch repair endonuclease MutL, partial [bacterium]
MSRIIKLPEDVANRIAAGEVVERPASVVKELVENSLDADAHYIEISLKRGGKELVQVSDDGEGMSPDDVLLAIQRHATSKISSAEDLNAISTFGFRGEALPSIASVSLLEIISRQRNSDTAFRILIDNGEILEQGEISAQPGTTITTTKLFDKIPARKRFLKSDTSELSRCNDVIIRLALANPDVSFRVESDGRETIYLTSCAEYIERIGQIFDDEVLEKLKKIHYESEEYSVFGFVGNRTIHRARSSDEYF